MNAVHLSIVLDYRVLGLHGCQDTLFLVITATFHSVQFSTKSAHGHM